jgi:hypothetical protein
MGIGHHTCHHHRLVVQAPHLGAGRRRLTAASRVAVPQALWPAVSARLHAGASLRVLANEYHTSRETIRRITQAEDERASRYAISPAEQ